MFSMSDNHLKYDDYTRAKIFLKKHFFENNVIIHNVTCIRCINNIIYLSATFVKMMLKNFAYYPDNDVA